MYKRIGYNEKDCKESSCGSPSCADTLRSLGAPRLAHPALFGHEANRAFRLMYIELIDNKNPLPVGIGIHRAADRRCKIRFGSGLLHRGFYHTSCGDLPIGDRVLGAMAGVLAILPRYLPGFYRCGRFSLQRLDTGLPSTLTP